MTVKSPGWTIVSVDNIVKRLIEKIIGKLINRENKIIISCSPAVSRVLHCQVTVTFTVALNNIFVSSCFTSNSFTDGVMHCWLCGWIWLVVSWWKVFPVCVLITLMDFNTAKSYLVFLLNCQINPGSDCKDLFHQVYSSAGTRGQTDQ